MVFYYKNYDDKGRRKISCKKQKKRRENYNYEYNRIALDIYICMIWSMKLIN